MEKRQLESTTSRDPAHKDGRWGTRGISNCLVSLYAQCRFTQLFPVLGVSAATCCFPCSCVKEQKVLKVWVTT